MRERAAKLEWYTTREVCELTGLPYDTVLRAGKTGEIPGMKKIRGRCRWLKSKVDEYVRSLDK